jgi:prevent-host-death family protein
MATRVTSRELRNDTRGVLDAVDAGDTVILTRHGVDVAEIRPLGPRNPVNDFLHRFAGDADTGWTEEYLAGKRADEAAQLEAESSGSAV